MEIGFRFFLKISHRFQILDECLTIKSKSKSLRVSNNNFIKKNNPSKFFDESPR